MNPASLRMPRIPSPGEPADPAGWISAFPFLAELKNAPQDPEHHPEGDAWIHTCLVCEAMVCSPAYASSGPERRTALFLAALLHDCAKAACLDPGPAPGRWRSPGHSLKGATIARYELWMRGCDPALREAVCRLILRHQIPFSWPQSKLSAEFLARACAYASDPSMALALARADLEGRGACPSQTEGRVCASLFEETCAELGLGGPGCPMRSQSAAAWLYFSRQGSCPFEICQAEADAAKPKPSLTLVCGCPAAGKDSWCALNFPSGAVSLDAIREQTGSRHGSADEGKIRRIASERLKAALREGQDAVFNATMLRQAHREEKIALALAYGANPRIVSVEAPAAEVLARNAARPNTLPNAKILRMMQSWQAPLPFEAPEVTLLNNPNGPQKICSNFKPF